MDVFDSCTFCSSRASSLPEGGLVHSWPGVLLGRSFQCGYFLFGWFLCPYPIYSPLLPSYLRPFSTLCYMPVIVFIPNVYNIATRSNSMGSSSWGPKDSLKRKERRLCSPAGPGPPTSCNLPASTFRVKLEATWTHVHHAQKETTKSILEEVEERKMSFYLIFIRRKED